VTSSLIALPPEIISEIEAESELNQDFLIIKQEP